MNQRIQIKFIAILLLLTLLPGIMPGLNIFADTTILNPPSQNRITDIGYVKNINVSEWYADLEWSLSTVNIPAEADEKYIILGMSEIERGSGQVIQNAISIPLSGTATSYNFTEYNPEGIKHGTIYETYLRASYGINTPSGRYTITSQKSNPAKFLTGLHVSVELIPGTNNIRIKWDDVWDTSGRINYKILISDTKGFTQPPPIPDISASEIGKPGSNVTINSAEKKLEYVYTHALPGREYSIKVVPLPSANVAYATAEEIEPVTIKTDILLKAQKVGYNNEGDTIWRLFWNPIVKGNTFTRVDYELYRYVNNDPEGKLYRLIPELDNYQITIKKGDTNTYSFRIDAKAYAPGSEVPVDFRSNNKVELKEQIPQYPQAPEIVDSFPPDDSDLKYDDFLTPFSASIFWKPPKTGEGLIDHNVTYDIYLLEDIQHVQNPPSNYKIASDLTVNEANMIRSNATGEIIGYRYNLTGLKSNSTYYFAIYAKKSYLVSSPTDGFMITRPYISKQSVKVIITKPDAGADRPVAPAAPPFGLKINDDGSDSVTLDGATLVMDKKWYAFYNEDSDAQRWEQVSYDDYIENELLDPDDAGKRISKEINYLPGWSIVPHVVNYNEAVNVIRMRNNRDPVHIAYSDLFPGSDITSFEIPQQKVIIPDLKDDEDQTFSFEISGLKDNTTYLVWITIENQNGVSSYPSDAIIITTPVDVPDHPVTPTVPDDLKGIAASSFVDLFWTYFSDMSYEIKGGTSDKLEQATITKQVSYEDIKRNTFFRVDSLEADTVYYFWIRAISTHQGQKIESEYSNPLVIKTQAHKPPAPPTGFGVDHNGVTENSITYIWNDEDGMSYYLEFSDDLSFTDSGMISVDGGTYTAGGLISNRRYYARLYAYDPKTQLRSIPTRTIMVITNKSKSEYDSSYDLDEPVAGDGLNIPARLDNGVWVVSSLGSNAHVLAERIRNRYESIVKLDLSVPPENTSRIRLELGSTVIDALSDTKKELYLILPWGEYTIRPGTFQTDEYFKMRSQYNNLELRLETISPASQYTPSNTMAIKTPVTDFKFSYTNGSPISMLNRPIRVELPVAGITGYLQGQIKTFAFNSNQGWYKLPTFTDYSSARVIGELDRAGAIVAATEGIKPQPTVPVYIRESMDRIQKIYDLKSIKGRNFNHNALMTQKDILKLLFDVLEAEYSEYDIVQKAVSAGLINNAGEVTGSYVRRDKAVDLLIELYKFKTRENPVAQKPGVWSHYTDLSKTDGRYLNSYKFALEMGIIQGNATNMAYPDRMVNLGEFLVMLERTLRVCGDL